MVFQNDKDHVISLLFVEYYKESLAQPVVSPLLETFSDPWVITAFRKANIELHKLNCRFLTECGFDLKLLQVEAGNQVCLVEEQPKEPKPKAQANDMITFRLLSLFKTRFF